MPKVDLKNMSMQELKSLQKKLLTEMAGREKRQRKDALNAVKDRAKQLGYSLDDLVTGKTPDTKSAAPKTAKRPPAPPKYRSNDDPSLTWSGRGRPPKWIKEAQDKGIDIETLRIEK